MNTMKPAIFLDRDGTIIHDVSYPRDPAEISILPGAVEALTLLHDTGFLLVVISNQSGIGRGMVTEDEFRRVHVRFVELFSAHDVLFDGAYYCPHAPDDACECRKPLPGMLQAAARELQIDLSRSFMVGDKPGDVLAGQRAGCRTTLIRNGQYWHEATGLDEAVPDAIVDNILAAAYWIQQHTSTKDLLCSAMS